MPSIDPYKLFATFIVTSKVSPRRGQVTPPCRYFAVANMLQNALQGTVKTVPGPYCISHHGIWRKARQRDTVPYKSFACIRRIVYVSPRRDESILPYMILFFYLYY